MYGLQAEVFTLFDVISELQFPLLGATVKKRRFNLDMTLQHDNATSHTACSVCDFLQDRNVSVLPWLAKSPDLNPIEHVWDLLVQRLRARAIPPRNVWELAGALVEEWRNISQQELAYVAVHEEDMHCST